MIWVLVLGLKIYDLAIKHIRLICWANEWRKMRWTTCRQLLMYQNLC